MRIKELEKIYELSVAERILLVEEIWDSILEHPETVPLTESQKTELEKRLSAYQENQEVGTPWTKVRQRILSNR